MNHKDNLKEWNRVYVDSFKRTFGQSPFTKWITNDYFTKGKIHITLQQFYMTEISQARGKRVLKKVEEERKKLPFEIQRNEEIEHVFDNYTFLSLGTYHINRNTLPELGMEKIKEFFRTLRKLKKVTRYCATYMDRACGSEEFLSSGMGLALPTYTEDFKELMPLIKKIDGTDPEIVRKYVKSLREHLGIKNEGLDHSISGWDSNIWITH